MTDETGKPSYDELVKALSRAVDQGIPWDKWDNAYRCNGRARSAGDPWEVQHHSYCGIRDAAAILDRLEVTDVW
ncbi:MAG: hypothetical protein U0821_18705 [Chloroflexota bacterium]